MKRGHSRSRALPRVWLVSDARNDAVLDAALRRLPRGTGLIFRHRHLDDVARHCRFAELTRGSAATAMVAGTAREARRWRAAGAYGAPRRLGPRAGGLRLATVHTLRELAQAGAAGADAVLLSPVFATRSHPDAASLGPVRAALIAARAKVPVLALGGMTARRERRLPPAFYGWAAIDGLSGAAQKP